MLYFSRKSIIFAPEIKRDTRIRQSESQSESNDNRTRRHPVDLLAGHLL